MAVLEVDFDGNIEDLQDQLDNADLETDATVKAETEGGVGGQEDGGGIPGGRTAIVGAIVALAGLLTPIKEILEGIRNFFLLTLAPVFQALRPLIDVVRDILIGIGRFLSGDLNLDDILGGIADVLARVGKQIANGVASVLSDAVPGINVNQPFPDAGGGGNQGQGDSGTRTGRRDNQPQEPDQDSFNPFTPQGMENLQERFIPDLTDEANKDRKTNQNNSQNQDSYGGDSGNFSLTI